MFTATRTPAPAASAAQPVRVTIHGIPEPDGRRAVELTVTVSRLHDPGAAARARELDAFALRGKATAAARSTNAVEKWQVLGRQLADCEAKCAAAAKALARAEAARVLLEDDLAPDLADKLRAVQSEVRAAVEARDIALRDLAEVQYLIPKHWAPAANSIVHAVSNVTGPRSLEAMQGARDARAALGEACSRASEMIARIISDVVAPAAATVQAHELANIDEWSEQTGRLIAEVRGQLVGAIPAGVKATDRDPRFFEVGDPPPPAPKPRDGRRD